MSFARRFFFSSVLVVLVAAVLVISWYAFENHRGARLWADTRAGLEARGESFDLAHFIPATVPDEQNLALAPFFAGLFRYRVDPATGLLTFNHDGNTHAALTTDIIPFGLKSGPVSGGPGWMIGRFLELEKFQRYYHTRADFPHPPTESSPAEEVLLALTRFGPMLDEIAQEVASHPQARFPVNWTQKPAALIALPHYNAVQNLVIALRLRACASLAAGHTDEAFRDVILGFRLGRAIGTEPTLIRNLVEVTCYGLLFQPVWEGLAAHRWSSQQLAELETMMAGLDMLRSYKHTLRSERPFFLLPLADDLRGAKDLNNILAAMDFGESKTRWPPWMSAMNRLFPRGWYDEAKSVVSRLDQQYIIDPIDPDHHRVDAREIDTGNAFIHALPVKPSTFLAKFCLPISSTVSTKIAHMQCILDEAVIACALERFHLDHGAYPPTPDALTAKYLDRLPTDVIDGAPVRYQLTSDGRYRLWETGWNGRDENGKIVLLKDTSRPDEKAGDWTWQYEGLAPPATP